MGHGTIVIDFPYKMLEVMIVSTEKNDVYQTDGEVIILYVFVLPQ